VAETVAGVAMAAETAAATKVGTTTVGAVAATGAEDARRCLRVGQL